MEPGKDGRLEAVIAVRVDEGADVRAAFENALRTLLALVAFNPDRDAARGTLETKDHAGVAVTTLLARGLGRDWSFATKAGVVALGTSPDALAAFLGQQGGGMPPRFEALRSAHFPEAAAFAIADLEGLERIGRARRDALVAAWAAGRGESRDDVGRDLDKALDLLGLFRLGFASTTIAADGRSSHQTLGLLARGTPKRP